MVLEGQQAEQPLLGLHLPPRTFEASNRTYVGRSIPSHRRNVHCLILSAFASEAKLQETDSVPDTDL